jgi:hypothetical protein
VEATTQDDFGFGGASQVPGLELRGENPRCDPGLLYLAMAMVSIVILLKTLLGSCSDFISRVKAHDLAFSGWSRRRRRLSVVSFLKTLLLEDIYRSPCVVKWWLVPMAAVVFPCLDCFVFFFSSSQA